MYTYSDFKQELFEIKCTNPCTCVTAIGQSLEGRNLYMIRVGKGQKKVFFCGAHHGSEWITSKMLVRFLKEELLSRRISPEMSIYVVPMVNPDGVEISQKGVPLSHSRYPELVEMNGGTDFTHWQANARGVDLNHNYAAHWREGKALEKEMGIIGPAPTRFSGSAPESEPESRAIANLTRTQKFDASIAFHSQGEVIYWSFLGKYAPDAKCLAECMARVSGYSLDNTEGYSSYGGYKDWVIEQFSVPSYTVEVGYGENPLPEEQIDRICEQNFPLMWEMIGYVIDKEPKKMYTNSTHEQ